MLPVYLRAASAENGREGLSLKDGIHRNPEAGKPNHSVNFILSGLRSRLDCLFSLIFEKTPEKKIMF